jgi:hypothetical protein
MRIRPLNTAAFLSFSLRHFVGCRVDFPHPSQGGERTNVIDLNAPASVRWQTQASRLKAIDS